MFPLSRSFEVPDPDGPDQGLDARHLLPQREGGEEARDHCAKRLRQDIPGRGDTIQHQVGLQKFISVYSCNYYSCEPLRISLTLACPMDLRLYPLDKQVCVLQIASCKYRDRKRLQIFCQKGFLNIYLICSLYCLYGLFRTETAAIPFAVELTKVPNYEPLLRVAVYSCVFGIRRRQRIFHNNPFYLAPKSSSPSQLLLWRTTSSPFSFSDELFRSHLLSLSSSIEEGADCWAGLGMAFGHASFAPKSW